MDSIPGLDHNPWEAQAVLHYPYANLDGPTAARFNRWVEVAVEQGAQQSGHYVFDDKKKTLEFLNLKLQGPQSLLQSVAAALSHVIPVKQPGQSG